MAQETRSAHWDLAEELLGFWHMEDFNVPQEIFVSCREAILELRQDHTFRTQSGEQVIEGFFIVEQRAGKLLITQQTTSHNGKPNCLGHSAEFVLAHDSPHMYVILVGDILQLYKTEEAEEPIARFSRKKR